MKRYYLYHYEKGYYNFTKKAYDNNHDFNFIVKDYTTTDQKLVISLCPYRGASIGTI